MKAVYLTYAFLFIVSARATPTPGSNRSSNPYLRFKTPSPVTTDSLCDDTKVRKKKSDAHTVCNTECLAIKTAISEIFNAHPDYDSLKYLNDQCGFVNVGKCANLGTAYCFSICWCYTSYGLNNQRRTSLFSCRLGIPLIRYLINSGIRLKRIGTAIATTDDKSKGNVGGLSRSGSSLGLLSDWMRSKTPGITIRVEKGKFKRKEDCEPEGPVLTADLHISGEKIRALLDTGSDVTFFSKRFATNIILLDDSLYFTNADDTEIKVYGKSTIYVEIVNGISIPVTGIVADVRHSLAFGCDFFLQYAAKIKIFDRSMEISTDQSIMEVEIKFRHPILTQGGQDLSSNSQPEEPSAQHYNPPLKSDPEKCSALTISGWVNGRETKVLIDTGASSSVVKKEYVALKNVEGTNIVAGTMSGQVTFKGVTNVEVWVGGFIGAVESIGYITRALVAKYDTEESLIIGNSFNKKFIELIDFEQKIVILKSPDDQNRVSVDAFFTKSVPDM